jgi:hypothetical protein
MDRSKLELVRSKELELARSKLELEQVRSKQVLELVRSKLELGQVRSKLVLELVRSKLVLVLHSKRGLVRSRCSS